MERSDEWTSLTCPFCLVRLKIRARYAHLRGRCPDCGIRIEPPRPKPADPASYVPTSTSAEPEGLLPLADEEWPEPALHEHPEHEGGHYQLADGPLPLPVEKPEPAPSGDVFSLEADAPSTPTKAPSGVANEVEAAGDGDEVFTLLPDAEVTSPKVGMPQRHSPAEPPEKAASQVPLPPALDPAMVDPIDVFQERSQSATPPPSPPVARPTPPAGRDKVMIPTLIEGDDAPRIARPARAPRPRPDRPVEPPPVAKLAPPSAPVAASGQDGAVEETRQEHHAPYQLSQAELKPLRVAPPPAHPFVQGILGFPFRKACIPRLVILAMGWMILGFFAGSAYSLLEAGGMIAVVGVGGLVMAMLMLTILTGSFAASLLFDVLQATAAGNDEVVFGDYDWRVALFQFLRLAWIFLLSVALPGLLLSFCLGPWPALFFGPATFAFCLLSSLAADSWFQLIHGGMIQRFAKKPVVGIILYFYSLVLGAACAGIGFATVNAVWPALFMGPLWAICWFLYARILGRAGFVLTYERPKRKRRKKQASKHEDGASAETGDSELEPG